MAKTTREIMTMGGPVVIVEPATRMEVNYGFEYEEVEERVSQNPSSIIVSRPKTRDTKERLLAKGQA